jgi:hypothetical protein
VDDNRNSGIPSAEVAGQWSGEWMQGVGRRFIHGADIFYPRRKGRGGAGMSVGERRGVGMLADQEQHLHHELHVMSILTGLAAFLVHHFDVIVLSLRLKTLWGKGLRGGLQSSHCLHEWLMRKMVYKGNRVLSPGPSPQQSGYP